MKGERVSTIDRRVDARRGYSWIGGWMQGEGIYGEEGEYKESVFMERRVNTRREYSWRGG